MDLYSSRGGATVKCFEFQEQQCASSSSEQFWAEKPREECLVGFSEQRRPNKQVSHSISEADNDVFETEQGAVDHHHHHHHHQGAVEQQPAEREQPREREAAATSST